MLNRLLGDGQGRRTSPRAKSGGAALLALMAATVMIAGCSLLPAGKQELEAPLIQPLQERVDTAEASRGTIETFLRGSANFVSNEVRTLSYKESGGRLKSIHVVTGQKVEAGELLAELETDELEVQIRLQRLNVERAQLFYKEAIHNDVSELTMLLREIDLERERTNLITLENRLEQAKLVAPIAGVITYAESLKPGDNVYPYQTIAALSDQGSLQLIYTASEPSALIALEAGMPVAISYKGASYTGKVLQAPASVPSRTDPAKAMQNATKVIIGLKDMPPNAQIGHSADMTITLQRRENAIILPRSAIRSFMGRSYVQIMDGDRRKEVDVEPGLTSGTEVEIVKGVEEGQVIVLGN